MTKSEKRVHTQKKMVTGPLGSHEDVLYDNIWNKASEDEWFTKIQLPIE